MSGKSHGQENGTPSFRERLLALAEEDYRNFSGALVPGKFLYGVRIPTVRKLAAECTDEFRQVWREVCLSSPVALEEQLYAGFVLARERCDFPVKLRLFRMFLKETDNWSACDSVCMAMKEFRRHPDAGIAFADGLLQSDREFEIRAGAVLWLAHYARLAEADGLIRRMTEISDGRLAGKFYAQMGVAWAFSVYLCLRDPGEERTFLESLADPDIRKKTVSKALESRRLGEDRRQILKTYREERRS